MGLTVLRLLADARASSHLRLQLIHGGLRLGLLLLFLGYNAVEEERKWKGLTISITQ